MKTVAVNVVQRCIVECNSGMAVAFVLPTVINERISSKQYE